MKSDKKNTRRSKRNVRIGALLVTAATAAIQLATMGSAQAADGPVGPAGIANPKVVRMAACDSLPSVRDLNVTKTVYLTGVELGVSSKVMLAGFETGWVESHMNNLNCGDADSLGVFQQRASWGTAAQRQNVAYAATQFFNRAKVQDANNPGYTAGQLAQKVQVSAYPTRYDEAAGTANSLLAEAKAAVGAGSAPETRSKVRWADIDGDGKDDYIVLNDNGSVRAFLNKGGDGHGGWSDYGQIASGLTTDRSKVRFADFDGDGKADYILINANGSIRVFLNKGGDGHGGWSDLGQVASGLTTDADQVRFADIDGDHKADYVRISPDGSVHAFLNKGGDGHGGWTDYGQIAAGMTTDAGKIRLADFDSDGRDDYIVINPNGSVRVFLNKGGDGHGGWSDLGQIASGMTSNANQVRFTDIGGDGRADYVVVNTNGSVNAFLNNGGDGHGGWTDYGQIASGIVNE